MDKLYIIIPAYNEESNIENVINDWYKVINNLSKDSRLVIIDDGSKDNTLNIINKLKDKYPKLISLTKPNSGHGATVLYGYNYAIKNKCDYVFQTDSDGQTNPEEFITFWNQRQDYDMLIGYRKHRKDGISRIIVTKTLKFVLLTIFHVNVTDANTPYRLINIKKLKSIIKLIPDDYHLTNVIQTVIFTKFKYNIKYINIKFKERQGGINSINIKKIFKIGLKSLHEFITINKNINIELKKHEKKN